jgi:hypothetical protein
MPVMRDRKLVEEIGRAITEHRDVNQGPTVALFCVRAGIEDLARHFEMLDRLAR